MKSKGPHYFISGYVCHAENLQTAVPPSLVECSSSEFTQNVSRRKLSHPTMELYDLSLYLFSYYKSLEDKKCIKKILLGFREISLIAILIILIQY